MARSRMQRLERRLIVLGILAVAFGGILLFRPSTVVGVSRDALDPLVPGFEKEAVRSIELSQTHPDDKDAKPKTVRLRKTSEGWVLPDRFGYAALPGSVARLLDDVADARERASVTRRKETFDKYRTGEGWVALALKDGGGKSLAELKIGRAERTDVFVMLERDGKPQVVRAINLRPRLASVDPTSWIDTQLWPEVLKASSMVRIDLTQITAKQPIVLVKRGASSEKLGVTVPDKEPDSIDKVWWMVSPQQADADTFEVQDIARAITGLLVEDIVARIDGTDREAAVKYGFVTPEVTAKLYEKVDDSIREHEVWLGKMTEDRKTWYVRRKDAPWVYAVAAGKGVNSLRTDPGALLWKEPKPEK